MSDAGGRQLFEDPCHRGSTVPSFGSSSWAKWNRDWNRDCGTFSLPSVDPLRLEALEPLAAAGAPEDGACRKRYRAEGSREAEEVPRGLYAAAARPAYAGGTSADHTSIPASGSPIEWACAGAGAPPPRSSSPCRASRRGSLPPAAAAAAAAPWWAPRCRGDSSFFTRLSTRLLRVSLSRAPAAAVGSKAASPEAPNAPEPFGVEKPGGGPRAGAGRGEAPNPGGGGLESLAEPVRELMPEPGLELELTAPCGLGTDIVSIPEDCFWPGCEACCA
mmetsp:Transcript_14988/g.35722  ORF Transcript_14988/g.35722 Transcript_14988/m.35722 type:complete len:275 (-) Transcript_14988:1523-2347(-)